MLNQPEHDRVVDWDLPLGPLLQRQHKGADQPFELPYGILDGSVRLRPIHRRRLEHRLHSEPLSHCPAQVDQRGLVVGLQ
eukprot:5511893-Alexandrium_andersonii.AAC.1